MAAAPLRAVQLKEIFVGLIVAVGQVGAVGAVGTVSVNKDIVFE